MSFSGFRVATAEGLRRVLVCDKISLNYSYMKNFWLVKQEPSSYSWSDLKRDNETSWTGVRNYTARNNLRKMRTGDEVFFYHSGDEKAVIGIARVTRAAYPDDTATDGDWSAVDLAPVRTLPRPVTLREIREHPKLKKMQLLRQSRLSVMPLTGEEFRTVTRIGALKASASA